MQSLMLLAPIRVPFKPFEPERAYILQMGQWQVYRSTGLHFIAGTIHDHVLCELYFFLTLAKPTQEARSQGR